MTGSLKKRSDNSWSIVLFLGRDPITGKKRQKWHTVTGNKKAAERELARLVNEINSGAYVEPAKITVADYLKRWLRDYAKTNVSGKTYERYEEISVKHLIPALGSLPLSKVQPLHIQAYYSQALESGRTNGDGGLSAQTVLHHHRVLREALNRAVKWQLLVRNPADSVEPPKPQRREMRAIDETQTAWLFEVARGTRFYAPVVIAVTTGMRRGEFLGLQWPDINLMDGNAIVRRSVEQTNAGVRFKSPKRRKGHRISLSPITVETLKQHQAEQEQQKNLLGEVYQDSNLVFAREDGSIWKPDTFTADFAKLARKAGLKGVRLHDMRHSHATQMLGQGIHPKIVSERLGHSTVGITMDIYSHVLPGMQENAVLKVDAVLKAAMDRQKKAKPV